MSLTMVKLSQVLKLEYGKGLPDTDRDTDGIYAAYGANGEKSRTNKFLYDKPSIIVGRKGSAGELTLIKDKFWALDVTYYVTHDDSKTDLMYLYYALQTKNLTSYARGVKPGINRNDVYELEIPLPPLTTQQKIVAKLDAIFAEIDKATAAAEANVKNAELLFQSYLTKVFEENSSNAKKLKECCLIKPSKSEARVFNDTDIVSFMPMEALGINDKFAIPNQERQLSDVSGSYTYFAEGDVLLAKITPCFENGKLGIAKDLTNRIGFGSSEYIVFRPNPEVDSSWLYYFLNRSEFRNNGAKHMSGAVGHKRVTKEFIEGTLLPLPVVLKQKQLVADIENILTFTKSLLSSSQNKVRELFRLKQSILKQAFNGELVKE